MAVKTPFPIVIGGGVIRAAGPLRVSVAPLITAYEAEGPKEMVVPATMIVPPGVNV
jgi:hypothetical protein